LFTHNVAAASSDATVEVTEASTDFFNELEDE